MNLNVGSNGIDSAGAAVLSYGLKCCLKLQSLDLSSNFIDVDGAAVLAHIISYFVFHVLHLCTRVYLKLKLCHATAMIV